MKTKKLLGCGLIGAACLLGCRAPTPPNNPPSPTRDHQPPVTDPGDGEIIGADRVPPAQKLEEGPKIDSEKGPVPADTPPIN
jgi:hypothetical protein